MRKTYNEMIACKLAIIVWHFVKIDKIRQWCVHIVCMCIEKDVKSYKEV